MYMIDNQLIIRTDLDNWIERDNRHISALWPKLASLTFETPLLVDKGKNYFQREF